MSASVAPLRVGVRIPPCRPLPEVIRLVQRAEAVGFDTVGFPDNPMLWRDTLTALSFAANDTDTVTLSTLVTNLVTHHPMTLASAIRTAAELAPGRVRLGVGAGDSSATLTGQRPARSVQLREGLHTIAELLAGRPAHVETPNLILHDPTAAPIFLAADRPRNLALAAEIADGVITTYRGLASKAAVISAAVANARRARPLSHVVAVTTRFTDDVEYEAHLIKPTVVRYIQREGAQVVEEAGFSVSVPETVALPDGTDLGHPRDLEAAAELASSLVSDELALWYVENLCAFGTGDEIAAKFRALEAFGVTEVTCSTGSAFSLPVELIEQVGSEVIPKLRETT